MTDTIMSRHIPPQLTTAAQWETGPEQPYHKAGLIEKFRAGGGFLDLSPVVVGIADRYTELKAAGTVVTKSVGKGQVLPLPERNALLRVELDSLYAGPVISQFNGSGPQTPRDIDRAIARLKLMNGVGDFDDRPFAMRRVEDGGRRLMATERMVVYLTRSRVAGQLLGLSTQDMEHPVQGVTRPVHMGILLPRFVVGTNYVQCKRGAKRAIRVSRADLVDAPR